MDKITIPAAVQSSDKGLGSIGKCGCLWKCFAVPYTLHFCNGLKQELKASLFEAPAWPSCPVYSIAV